MFEKFRKFLVTVLGVILCLYTLVEVNYPRLQPQSELAVFVMLGMVLCFLVYPLAPRFKDNLPLRLVDMLLAGVTAFCCLYVVVQTEPMFKSWWSLGNSLGDRAGIETPTDFWVAIVGLVLVLEVTRRSIGWIVPVLALLFVVHSYYCYLSNEGVLEPMYSFLLPHSGQSIQDIASTTFLQSLGVFGPAATVMFKYVFLFVLFGSFLEMSGATQFIIAFAQRVFGRFRAGPPLVAVWGSGLMGSLSGSAVANAVTTGAFTIPMMRNSGYPKHVAGGITAASASGGALMPPVMGAGAYMMLELIKRPQNEPAITFLEIAMAALIPAILYYLSLTLIVIFYSMRISNEPQREAAGDDGDDDGAATSKGKTFVVSPFEALVFFGALGVLLGLLCVPVTAFRAVTGSLVYIMALTTFRQQLKLSSVARKGALTVMIGVAATYAIWVVATGQGVPGEAGRTAGKWLEVVLNAGIIGMLAMLVFGLLQSEWRPYILEAFTKSAKNGIALVAASACVGIIIGIVQQTGIASDFSGAIKGLVASNLFLALLGIMLCSLVLGMGVPSVVCYLLMATLMGSLLGELGVRPLAAHFFIFYFGMMSMVTPPVALAAYASASIAEARIMPTSMAAFRFSLVGFTLPFMFVYRPALLLIGPDGGMASLPNIVVAVTAAILGILALAIGIVGFCRNHLAWGERVVMLLAAALLLAPNVGGKIGEVSALGLTINLIGVVFLAVGIAFNLFKKPLAPPTIAPDNGG